MSTLQQTSTDFTNLLNAMRGRIRSVLYEESRRLLNDFQQRAPVDTGLFRSNWRLRRSRFASKQVIAGVILSNPTPYGIFMDEGAGVGKPPWNFSGKSKTGKLVVRNGRVWAGGLNPGHSKTVGGATGPVLLDNPTRVNQLTNKIADVVIGGF